MLAGMSEKIIFLGSILFGTVGGIAWSQLPSTDRARPAVATTAAHLVPAPTVAQAEAPVTASPQDLAWSSRRSPPAGDARGTQRQLTSGQSVHYSGCNEVRALGKAPLYEGQPGYREDMDGDGDGIACEPYRGG